jgi:glycosyltransferase involved in cell wall biosynthesis
MFVTNFCAHYRVKTFELFAQVFDAYFLFFSAGQERYWDPRHGLSVGNFPHHYLPGFNLLPNLRITPRLLHHLLVDDYDVVIKCINGRFALPVTFLIAKLRQKPFVLWTGIWHHPQTLFHRLTFPLTRFIYLRADAIVTYGTHVKQYLIELGVSGERIFPSYHATENELYRRPVASQERERVRAQVGVETRPVILYVGRLVDEKGLDVLIDAVACVGDPEPVLLLVGEGELRPGLRERCDERGVIAKFAGYIPNVELYRFYAVADVFVLPSVTTRTFKEPWGLVVNEAMNQGVPVIATNAVGAAAGGLVKHGETGLVVPERDVYALAAALRKLLREPDLRQRLGNAGRAHVLKWDNRNMVKAYGQAAAFALGAGPPAAEGLIS